MTLTFVWRSIKFILTIALHSALNISETIGDRGLVPKDHQWEMAWAINWSRDRWRHAALKGAVRQYGRLS